MYVNRARFCSALQWQHPDTLPVPPKCPHSSPCPVPDSVSRPILVMKELQQASKIELRAEQRALFRKLGKRPANVCRIAKTVVIGRQNGNARRLNPLNRACRWNRIDDRDANCPRNRLYRHDQNLKLPQRSIDPAVGHPVHMILAG